MRFIINNKIYNTEKATLLCEFKKQYESKTPFGTLYPYRDTQLYLTAKGAYFLVYKYDYKHYARTIDEAEAKDYLMLHNYDKYAEMFGALEEA